MKQKVLKVALIGKTNSGKSTLLNKIIGETISIINKKVNTTQEIIIGIFNDRDTQIVFYDTPGLNFIKTIDKVQKKLKSELWQGIDESDIILFLLDSSKINLVRLEEQLIRLNKLDKKILFVFNKIDLIKKNILLSLVSDLNKKFKIESFFYISARYGLGIKDLIDYIKKLSKVKKWLFPVDQISNKNNIFITNECTRNAVLTFLHKEIPYNIKVYNQYYKFLKNGDLKIKQKLKIDNLRYKKIVLGKKGEKIKKIREFSQIQISKIFDCKTHLYIELIVNNAK